MMFNMLIISLIILFENAIIETIDVSIDTGQSSATIRGADIIVLGRTIYTFRKIPYAKPPIGSQRFKYAQPLDTPPWEGIYDATVSPATCFQSPASTPFDLNNPASTMWYSKIPMSEDCLYLTIWTPAIGVTQNLPVMVWIYGGSYMSGSNTLEVYDGSILSSLFSVIVVSIQFRVGPLGYLFFANTESPGNQALMDQRMALQWINQNIVKFGGDPNKVTIFAESSGATSLSIHTFSPQSASLFQKVILESGNLLMPWAIESPPSGLAKAQFFIDKANCTKTTVINTMNCLRSLTAQQIFDLNGVIRNQIADARKKNLQGLGYTNLYSDGGLFFDIYFRPVFADNFVNQSMIQQLIQGDIPKNKAFLFGTNANEAMYFLIYGLSNYLDIFTGSNVQLPQRLNYPADNFVDPYKIILENILDLRNQFPVVAQLLLHQYSISSVLFDDNLWSAQDLIRQLDLLGSDEQFICPTIQLADSITKMGQTNVYMYVFDVTTVKMPLPSWVGVMHGYEIEYVFGMPWSSVFTSKYFGFTDEEKNISNITMTMWTNFVKYGNPTPDGTATNGKVYWPLYTYSDKQYLKLTKDSLSKTQIGANYKSKECKLWTKVLPVLRQTLIKTSSGCTSLIECNLFFLLISIVMTFIDKEI